MKRLKYVLFSSLALLAFTSCRHDTNNDTTTTETKVNVEKPTKLETLTDLNNVILYSLDNTYLVIVSTTIKDSGTTVYSIEKNITIDDTETKSGSCVTYTSSLDSTFSLSKDTKVDSFENLDVKSLFSCNLNESYLSSTSISITSVTYNVKASNAKDYFKDEDALSDTDVKVVIAVNDFKMTSISYSYTYQSKTISSTTTYSYLA